MTFIYCFLPVVCVCYFAFKNRTWRNAVLLVASLIFYSWGEPSFAALMILATFIAYIGGLLMNKTRFLYYRSFIFVITVILITANLFIFKYFNFVIENIEAITGSAYSFEKIALPIGISFYTFQILSYVIDLYRKEVAVQKNFFKLLLYVSLFPQLIAGPIVRYKTIENEIDNRTESLDAVAAGTRRFILGLSKKLLISNGAARIVEIIYAGDPNEFGTLMYWLAAISYALQIYFDFSGYSDMAIGAGKIFGFNFLENFDHPYTALSITEFWRKWHISLSSWFRDYIYIPLGGNRVGKGRWVFNILIVWALTGLWHGASWNFVLWGLYFAVFLIVEKLFLGKLLSKLPKFIQWIYSAFVVVVGWVIFYQDKMDELIKALSMMFSLVPTNFTRMVANDSEIFTALIFIPLGIICMLPISNWLEKGKERSDFAKNVLSLVLLALCVAFVLSTKFNPFIYFRF